MAEVLIEGLTVGYNAQAVIEDCSLHIADGCLFTLLGPSGCGKTTLLRAIAGFVPVRAGRILFGGRDVTHASAHTRDVGMVFQDYALFPDKSVFDNVAYGLRARKFDPVTIKKTVMEHLERVGLIGFETRRPAELSGGQRQRVALARALAIKPSVLLMDEPLSNLDAKLRAQVRETISDLQKEVRITTVLVTHDQEEALALSDRVGLMRAGKLVQVDSPQMLYAKPNNAYAADFVGGANLLPVTINNDVRAAGDVSVQVEGETIMAHADRPLPAGPATLIVRGEALMLQAAAARNALPVTVTRAQFLGNRTVLTLALASGFALRAEVKNDVPIPEIGSCIFAQLSPEQARLVAQ